MIRGAIFDVDGTLLDSMSIWEEAGVRYLESIQVEPEPGLSRILYPMTIEEGVAYTKEHYHLPQSAEEITEGLLMVVRDFYYKEVQAKKDVIKFLKKLYVNKIPMIVATAGHKEYAKAALQRLEMDHYFQDIVTCSELGRGKHEPEIYLQCVAAIRRKPEETMVFEDAGYAIETAKNAGFITVGVRDMSNGDDWQQIRGTADYTLETWSEADKLPITVK